jgi:hypothetical protein
MNEREQLELENYLREFKPRAPRALPLIRPAQNWRRLAAAIAILLFGTASLWGVFHHAKHDVAVVRIVVEQPSLVASTIPLTKLAFENPREFESALDAQALKTLQKFDRTDSALRALAKE